MRPSLALGIDPLVELAVVDVGDIDMPSGNTDLSCARLEFAVEAIARSGAIPIVLGGDHTIARPDATGCARHAGWGRGSLPPDRPARVLARTRNTGLDGRTGYAQLRDDRDCQPGS